MVVIIGGQTLQPWTRMSYHDGENIMYITIRYIMQLLIPLSLNELPLYAIEYNKYNVI